jgi:hypothetical protein
MTKAALDAYVAYFETLTPETVVRLGKFVTLDVHFRDPFNDVRGEARFRAVLDHMFLTTDDSRFAVTDRAIGATASYVRWRYTFRPKGRSDAPWEIVGMTEIVFDDAGRVSAHLDHWDAAGQIYERIPVLGTAMRWIRRRAAAE